MLRRFPGVLIILAIAGCVAGWDYSPSYPIISDQDLDTLRNRRPELLDGCTLHLAEHPHLEKRSDYVFFQGRVYSTTREDSPIMNGAFRNLEPGQFGWWALDDSGDSRPLSTPEEVPRYHELVEDYVPVLRVSNGPETAPVVLARAKDRQEPCLNVRKLPEARGSHSNLAPWWRLNGTGSYRITTSLTDDGQQIPIFTTPTTNYPLMAVSDRIRSVENVRLTFRAEVPTGEEPSPYVVGISFDHDNRKYTMLLRLTEGQVPQPVDYSLGFTKPNRSEPLGSTRSRSASGRLATGEFSGENFLHFSWDSIDFYSQSGL